MRAMSLSASRRDTSRTELEIAVTETKTRTHSLLYNIPLIEGKETYTPAAT